MTHPFHSAADLALAAHAKLAMAMGLGGLRWRPWFLKIWSSFVGGGAGAVAATFANVSMDSAYHEAINVHQILVRAAITFALAGGLHLAVFLSAHPAPDGAVQKEDPKP